MRKETKNKIISAVAVIAAVATIVVVSYLVVILMEFGVLCESKMPSMMDSYQTQTTED